MITINSYLVTERAVYEGVDAGVDELLKDVSNFTKPEVVVNVITNSVMQHLCQTMDFGEATVKLTPDLIRKMYLAAQAQSVPDPSPPTN